MEYQPLRELMPKGGERGGGERGAGATRKI
jgi:hypothetical protein